MTEMPELQERTVMQKLTAELEATGRTQLTLSPEMSKRYGLQRQIAWKFGDALNAKVKTLAVTDGLITFGLIKNTIP